MARKRMYSPKIVESDDFLDLPDSSKVLYFYLNLNADDDGFVQPKKIVRMLGVPDDSLKLLVVKGFAITFQTGVLVLTHWNENNFVRKDRYIPTLFKEEMASLELNDNGFYLVNQRSTTGMHRLDKIRLDKIRLDKEREDTSTIKEIKYSSIKEITQDVLQEISLRYDVPPDFVADCWDSALNWLEAKGTTKKNYKSFLANWVKREKVNLMVKKTRGGYVDARGL